MAAALRNVAETFAGVPDGRDTAYTLRILAYMLDSGWRALTRYLCCRLGGPLPIPVPRMCALRRVDPGQRTLFGTTGEAEPEMRTARPRSPNAGGRARGEKKGVSP